MHRKRYLDDAYRERTGEETRDFYDRWSQVYDEELSENAYSQPTRCALAMAMQLSDRDAPILDAGCGTGLSGLALAAAGFTWIDGCDFSPGMIEKAKKLKLYRSLFIADLNRTLAVPDATYGGLAAVGVFSFGHVKASAVDEFHRIVRPGGIIVIGVNDHFYREGSLIGRIDELARAKRLETISCDAGEHLPGIGLSGWVIVLRRN